MTHATGITQFPNSPRPHARGPALGWGISLLVHALAVAWLWHAWQSRPVDQDTAPAEPIEVRLIPLPPAAPSAQAAPTRAPVHATAAIHTQAADTAAAPKPATPPQRAPDVIEVPAPAAPTADRNPPETPAAASTPAAADTPAIDIASARAAARLIARENPKGLVALPERKTVIDANADHHVVDRLERARRVDCQTARAQSTNLLANVVMLAVDLAKNAVDDSGCKWQ